MMVMCQWWSESLAVVSSSWALHCYMNAKVKESFTTTWWWSDLKSLATFGSSSWWALHCCECESKRIVCTTTWWWCGDLKSFAVVSSSWALYCYECESEQSFAHCDSVREEEQCSEDEDLCGSASATGMEDNIYLRGCVSEETYKQFQSTCADQGAVCEVRVCKSDFCNGGAMTVGGGGSRRALNFLKRKKNL